jgi:hypothetical protein
LLSNLFGRKDLKMSVFVGTLLLVVVGWLIVDSNFTDQKIRISGVSSNELDGTVIMCQFSSHSAYSRFYYNFVDGLVETVKLADDSGRFRIFYWDDPVNWTMPTVYGSESFVALPYSVTDRIVGIKELMKNTETEIKTTSSSLNLNSMVLRSSNGDSTVCEDSSVQARDADIRRSRSLVGGA